MRLFALIVVALAGPTAPSPAQEPALSPVQESPAARPDRGHKCLLHMEGGSVLRARAREVPDSGGAWEVRKNGEWIRLDAGQVRRVAREADVLREARSLEAKLPRGARTQRVALASWMADQGLWEEAFGQMDRVLADAEDDPAALQQLARWAANEPLLTAGALEPEHGLEPTLRQLGGAPPTALELGILKLADTPDLRAGLIAQLGHSQPRVRRASARALRRHFSGQQLGEQASRALASRAVLDSSADVRREAGLALRDAEDEALVGVVASGLRSEYSKVRENAAAALGTMGYRAAAAPLVNYVSAIGSAAQSRGGGGGIAGGSLYVGNQTAYVQDFDVEVAQGAAIADPQINVLTSGAVLDARVVGARQINFTRESYAARRALHHITGASPGNTNKAWLEWWEENERVWNAPPTGDEPTRVR